MNAMNKDLLTPNVGKKHAVFDIVLTNKRNNTPFFYIYRHNNYKCLQQMSFR